MLLFYYINLVKYKIFWFSKIVGMSYNLERREYMICSWAFANLGGAFGTWHACRSIGVWHETILPSKLIKFKHDACDDDMFALHMQDGLIVLNTWMLDIWSIYCFCMVTAQSRFWSTFSWLITLLLESELHWPYTLPKKL